jgi:carbamoyl-phosphate synthase large subunit
MMAAHPPAPTDDRQATTVAVTGVGAIIGQGIVRSLRASGRDIRIVGVDRNPNSPGTHLCDAFEPKPAADEGSAEYAAFWQHIIRRHRIRLVMPGLDVDMEFLDAHRDAFRTVGCELALNTRELISQTRDKWEFGRLLRSAGLPSIPSARPATWDEALEVLGPAPLLLKPLRGNGSRGIVRLHDAFDFGYWSRRAQGPWMLQRIVGADDQEFTVAVFGVGDGHHLGPLIMRRRLSSAGNTLQAEVVVQHALLERAVSQVCDRFRPLGPTNLQFRVEADTPYLLEINPRFSSSNSLRTAFGFNESAMAVDLYLHGQTPAPPAIRPGIGWRYAEDFVIHAGDPV